MEYISALTSKGNSSRSFLSQKAAEARAAQLDAQECVNCIGCTDCYNCTDCTDCYNCVGCTDCYNCVGCTDCTDCANCSHCTNCTNCADCTNCSHCTDCYNCSDCSRCSDCFDCSGDVILAGRPNGWPCHGWLKDGKLFIHCGCRRKTYAEAVTYWRGKPSRAEVLSAVEYIAAVARLRGWEV